MDVVCKYYELKSEKFMQDGHFISAKQKLLYICTEENFLQFETIDKTDIKRIFWATEEEVNFLETKIENWTKKKIQRQKKEINGTWLTK
jgi:hypothetical protein